MDTNSKLVTSGKWESFFHKEKLILKAVFGDSLVTIMHIGSSALKGVVTRPLVDILVVLHDIRDLEKVRPSLREFGFSEKESSLSRMHQFVRESKDVCLYVTEYPSPYIAPMHLFPEYLATHPAEARQYGQAKEELAKKWGMWSKRYADEKSSLIQEINDSAAKWIEFACE